MKHSKFFVAVVLFSSFSNFCNASEIQGLTKRLLGNSTSASFKQLPNEENSVAKNALCFAAGSLCGVAGAKVYDSIKGKVNDTDNRDSEIEELKLKLANAERELAKCKIEIETHKKELKLKDDKISYLLDRLDCKENDNKDDDRLFISKGRAKNLSKMFSQISERVSLAHLFSEDLICASRYLKENNVDVSEYFKGTDNMNDVEKMAVKVHSSCIECAKVLRRMGEHLREEISLESVEKTWQEGLEHLKKYNLDILN